MIVVVNAENRRLFPADLVQMHRQRKAVFVDAAGWKIPVFGDMEMDAYDREDTIYLLAKNHSNGPVLASVRLLTTTGPHLMSDLFDAEDLESMPRGPAVWEVSRFCTGPQIRSRDRRHALLWEMICGVIETALLYGIDQVIFAASRALLPLALHCGWEARTLRRSYPDDGSELTAVAAATTPQSLRGVRERHGVPVPVTRFQAIVPPPALDLIESQLSFCRVLTRPSPCAWCHLWRETHLSTGLSPGAPRHD